MADDPVNKRATDPNDVSTDERARNQERRLALARLSRAALESRLYDRNEFPEGGQDE
jgi:hypothetical protein